MSRNQKTSCSHGDGCYRVHFALIAGSAPVRGATRLRLTQAGMTDVQCTAMSDGTIMETRKSAP